jgi:hypothetical protein
MHGPGSRTIQSESVETRLPDVTGVASALEAATPNASHAPLAEAALRSARLLTMFLLTAMGGQDRSRGWRWRGAALGH